MWHIQQTQPQYGSGLVKLNKEIDANEDNRCIVIGDITNEYHKFVTNVLDAVTNGFRLYKSEEYCETDNKPRGIKQTTQNTPRDVPTLLNVP